jgi:hypothetical protein
MWPVLAAGIGLLVGALGAIAVFGQRVTALEVRAELAGELKAKVEKIEKDINGVAQIARRCSHREDP